MQTKVDIYQSDSQIVRDAIDKVIVQFYRKKKENKHKSFLLSKLPGSNIVTVDGKLYWIMDAYTVNSFLFFLHR